MAGRTTSKGRVTLRQVAEACGLSIPTVCQILNDKGWYREETRAAVLAAVKTLGYRPNGLAQAVQRGHLGLAAVLLPWQSSHGFQPEGLLFGIEAGLAERNLHCALARMPDPGQGAAGYLPRILRELTADAMILTYNANLPASVMTAVEDQGVPAVWVNSRPSNLHVTPDDHGGAREATRLLQAMGHRRIAYLSTGTGRDEIPWHPSSLDRFAGYQEAQASVGLPEIRWQPAQGVGDAGAVEVVRGFLRLPDQPTAIVAYNLREALCVVTAALEAGRRIPDDLSLVTFHVQPATGFGLPLSTVIIPVEQMGRRAAALVADALEDKPVQSETLPMGWYAGGTIAAPRST